MAARIILLNGTSSAGKSTLAAALRPLLPETFCYYASDQLADARFRPLTEPARWEGREAFFSGFHRSIAAFAEAGLDLLVEHIVEQASWADQLRDLLHPFDTFWVGVHVPLDVLEQRERLRGDRALGEAQEHHRTHDHCVYGVEVENVGMPAMAATQVFQAWSLRHG
jgi:chloramphenicol 3-O phosphotransferase